MSLCIVTGAPLSVVIHWQQEYTALRDQHLMSGEGFILVFAITDRNSFEEVKQLRESIINLRNTNKIPLVVAGNKCVRSVRNQKPCWCHLPQDMEDQREVDSTNSIQWCQSVRVPYFETSAKVSPCASIHCLSITCRITLMFKKYFTKLFVRFGG